MQFVSSASPGMFTLARLSTMRFVGVYTSFTLHASEAYLGGTSSLRDETSWSW